MQLVVQEAMRQTSTENQAVLGAGTVFVDIRGLDLQQTLIGVSIPARSNGPIRIAFLADHFQATSVPTLAKEMLADLERARAEQRH
jgi:hypothetical protein